MAQIKVFTDIELDAYFKNGMKWHFYALCEEKYRSFLPHSDGVKPVNIIERQRPNEPDEVREFRLAIWEPITKPTFSRVLSSLSKIRRSTDWAVVYPKEEFGKIRDGFELQAYCEGQYPYFTSVTNWMFGVWLKQYLIDSNGVVLVLPLNKDTIEETDYLEPFTEIYNSCDVIDFKENEYAILNIAEGCYYKGESGNIKRGKSFYVVTGAVIQRWDQVGDNNTFAIQDDYPHNLGFLPAFKNGGVVCNSERNYFAYESRISGLLPNLNEAIAEYTDLQAGKRLNIYPERWEYTQHECPKCRGIGAYPNTAWKAGDPIEARQIKCTCVNGYIPSGPFAKMLLRPQDIGQQAMPTPPAGYIEKPIDIIELMQSSVDSHIYKALAAINFQFLEQTPLNQSGTAKEVDKDELNNTVHGIAEDVVAMMDKIYATIAMYRYSKLYTAEEIELMLPVIPVPEHYDLISSQYMQEEIQRSRAAQINSLLVSQMEVEFGGKRFPQNPEINNIIKLSHALDPLPGKTIDEKIAMASNKTITRVDNVISDNIINYIRRALFENEEFDSLNLEEQKAVLVKYAEEQISSMDEAAKLAANVISEGEEEGGDDDSITDDENIEEEELINNG